MYVIEWHIVDVWIWLRCCGGYEKQSVESCDWDEDLDRAIGVYMQLRSRGIVEKAIGTQVLALGGQLMEDAGYFRIRSGQREVSRVEKWTNMPMR